MYFHVSLPAVAPCHRHNCRILAASIVDPVHLAEIEGAVFHWASADEASNACYA